MHNKINISKKAAQEIANLINTMNCNRIYIEQIAASTSRGEYVDPERAPISVHMMWYNEAAESLRDAGIPVSLYPMTPLMVRAAKDWHEAQRQKRMIALAEAKKELMENAA